MLEIQNFMSKFLFDPAKAGKVGIEIECFLLRDGVIAPIAAEVLSHIDDADFTNEMSACQLEYRVGPIDLSEVPQKLQEKDDYLTELEARHNFRRSYQEIILEGMPLDVFPDTRYLDISSRMPPEVLTAACQVIGLHVHVGLPDHETALDTYNRVVPHTPWLISLGDGSNGARMKAYHLVSPDSMPPQLPSWEHFHEMAVQNGFVGNPRDNWKLIRLTAHGTIEFRMFGSTSDIGRVASIAESCHTLCF